MTRLLAGLAGECCPGRLVFALEGGYDLQALASGVAAVLAALLGGGPAPEEELPADGATRRVLERLRVQLAGHWPILT
jgi:acetoin utilization deacetylase AcuC-like enzyme